MDNKLFDLYQCHQGKISDKWSSYLHYYDKLFSTWQDKPIQLLEIGVHNGGSLEIWASYFPHAQLLIGCDIDPRCASLQYDDERVKIIIADAYSDEGAEKIQKISPSLDIIIEDGSHQSAHIIDAFVRYFPLLNEGGIFIAEDLHCSYWHQFGGGLSHPFSALSFFKQLVDIVNFEHWGTSLQRIEYLAKICAHHGCQLNEQILASIHSIEFVNSTCVIHKASISQNQLGERKIAGKTSIIDENILKINGTYLKSFEQENNYWSNKNLKESTIEEKEAIIAKKEAIITEKEAIITEKESIIAEKDVLIAELKQGISSYIIKHASKKNLLHKILPFVQRIKEKQIIQLCKNSPLFNETWYLTQYIDVKNAGIDPVTHYVKFGAKELRDPSSEFSTLNYLLAHTLLLYKYFNPLAHYEKYQSHD